MTDEDKQLPARFAALQAEHDLLTERLRVFEQQHNSFCDVVQNVALTLALSCAAYGDSEAARQVLKLGNLARLEKQTRASSGASPDASDADAYDLRSLHVDTTACDIRRPESEDD